MSDKYVLNGHNPEKCGSMEEWAKWYETANRRVAHTLVGDVSVSTVFLGRDHSFGGHPPLLFETMIFGGEHDQYQERCTFWDEAEKQHAEAVKLATAATV